MQENDGLKTIRLELENFKNITKKVIEIGGKSVLFMGPNGSGKSTLVQVMTGTLNSKNLPTEPVMAGEERAKISHTIAGNIGGEHREYIIDVYFTQNDQKGRVVVTNEKGETMKSPATIIKNVIGNVSFDVTKWLNDDKPKKLETLKALTGKGVEIDVANMAIKDLKTKRKNKSDRADELEGALKNHEFTQEEIEKYSTPVDMNAIQQEMAIASKNVAAWDETKRQVDAFRVKIDASKRNISKAEEEIARLHELLEKQNQIVADEKTAIAKMEQNITLGDEWLKNTPRPEMSVVNEKMSEAIKHNEKHSRLGILGQQQKEMVALKAEVEQIKIDIERKVNERNAIISSSQLSIPGISFTDEDIFIDGLPLEEGQINTARLFDIGVDIAIALNPTLKVIFLHDGSLFDKNHLASIVKKIEDHGYMAVVELVNFEGGELEVKFAETELA